MIVKNDIMIIMKEERCSFLKNPGPRKIRTPCIAATDAKYYAMLHPEIIYKSYKYKT
jgi:hypothetical protein